MAPARPGVSGAALPAELADRAARRSFLDRYYGISRLFYDATRKYYLFGRDRTLAELLTEPWTSLVEVGAGTGRNLRKLYRRRPHAAYGGIEPCAPMRLHGRSRAPWAKWVDAFSEDADYLSVLGRRPDRILFSYCLSMVRDPAASLRRAVDALAPGGEVAVVDFGLLDGIPRPARAAFLGFLESFHVSPANLGALPIAPHRLRMGPAGYFVTARYRADERSS